MWWVSFATNVVPSEEWRENFRMSRATFFLLCDMLKPHVEHQSTRIRSLVEVERQVALALYYLADEERMRKLQMLLGCHAL